MQQTTFASVAWQNKGKITRRERFLAEMDAVIPWSRLLALIEPHYPKAGNGTQPKPMGQMLRIYFMQNWFNLSDPQAEDSLYDIESMRRFAGIELHGHDIPDESTILRFRHLLEQHQLTERIFAEIRSLLEEKRLLLKSGTIVDATIIAAPPSTKNEQGKRDPEMHQTKKGKDWHFGMKAHIGTDRRGVVRYRINRRATRTPLTDYQRFINRRRSATRARVEHAFHVVKHLWGFTKVRYRGLAKNSARLHTAFALANLYLLRRRLLPPQWSCAL
jgi:transposase, IS5 family